MRKEYRDSFDFIHAHYRAKNKQVYDISAFAPDMSDIIKWIMYVDQVGVVTYSEYQRYLIDIGSGKLPNFIKDLRLDKKVIENLPEFEHKEMLLNWFDRYVKLMAEQNAEKR